MNKSHVTSLALAKELHDLIVEKGMEVAETEFYWRKWDEGGDWEIMLPVPRGKTIPVSLEEIPAYLSSELGEMLTDDCDYFSGRNWNEDMFSCNVHRGLGWCFR